VNENKTLPTAALRPFYLALTTLKSMVDDGIIALLSATALAIAIAGRRSLSSTTATTAAITVAITTTTNARLYCSRRWLVVVLFNAVRFCHRTPSCNH
jgi:hypothetical protein